ncbi:MAG: 16S rRNA (cytidine(1402)-2'-O)-methyltransferase [Gammaproteobacteria bacterium]
MAAQPGILHIVATPIGNLADTSERARQVLAGVDLILAEDTRHSSKLLSHFGIQTPLLALHEHNEDARTAALIQRLQRGEQFALISDAGTPLISDPGYRLVNAALAAGIRLVPIPGPSAVITALSVAGQPTDRFVFEGYLPAKAGARQKRLAELAIEPRTLVFYESPHRLLECLDDMATIFGTQRPVTLAKELTKQFEQIQRGTFADIHAWLLADVRRLQGEFVLVVAGNTASRPADDPTPLLRLLLQHLPVKTATAIAQELTGQPRNSLYPLAVKIQRETSAD